MNIFYISKITILFYLTRFKKISLIFSIIGPNVFLRFVISIDISLLIGIIDSKFPNNAPNSYFDKRFF